MEEILRYFPNLTDHQISQFEALGPLYQEWNEKNTERHFPDDRSFYASKVAVLAMNVLRRHSGKVMCC